MADAHRGNMKLLQQSPGLAAASTPYVDSGMRQPHAKTLGKFWVLCAQPIELGKCPFDRLQQAWFVRFLCGFGMA
jgi:hypothetical protein